MNLLTVAIPALERLSKEEDGRQKIEKITRYVGVGLALVQSVGIVLAMGESAVYNPSFLTSVSYTHLDVYKRQDQSSCPLKRK